MKRQGAAIIYVCVEKHILIDCGMEQGNDVYENQELPIPSSEIDFVLLTHAHIDHSGLIPLLYTKGFRGKVYCTKPTKDLCEIMLKDSAHIQMFEAEWRNRKAKRSNGSLKQFVPLYDMDAAVNVMNHFVGCPYDSVLDISEGIRIRFTDAGHLLGSASIEIWVEEEKKSQAKLCFLAILAILINPLSKTLNISKKPIMWLWNQHMEPDSMGYTRLCKGACRNF